MIPVSRWTGSKMVAGPIRCPHQDYTIVQVRRFPGIILIERRFGSMAEFAASRSIVKVATIGANITTDDHPEIVHYLG